MASALLLPQPCKLPNSQSTLSKSMTFQLTKHKSERSSPPTQVCLLVSTTPTICCLLTGVKMADGKNLPLFLMDPWRWPLQQQVCTMEYLPMILFLFSKTRTMASCRLLEFKIIWKILLEPVMYLICQLFVLNNLKGALKSLLCLTKIGLNVLPCQTNSMQELFTSAQMLLWVYLLVNQPN